MERLSEVSKVVLSPRFRAGRRYYFTNDDSSPMQISTRVLERTSSAQGPALDNPLVLAAFIAGVIGVVIIVVIMIGVWIKTKLIKSASRSSSAMSQQSQNNPCNNESTMYMSSMSTLDDFGNEPQVVVDTNDDNIDNTTTVFDGELESVVVATMEVSEVITISSTSIDPADVIPVDSSSSTN